MSMTSAQAFQQAYVLGMAYTDETAIQFGGLKGASCQIKSIVKDNGRNTVTFLWRNDDGDERESEMTVDDGTKIEDWTSGTEYSVGDFVVKDSSLYRCKTANSDSVFTPSKWDMIGGTAQEVDELTPEEVNSLISILG